jgi:KaiC/GvpD/RAD55 family RecA-like ATPase
MPLDLTPEKLLERAKDQEKKYGWLYAVWSYEQALQSATEIVPSAAETWQRIGFCYERASRQTQDVQEFTKLRQQAVEAYQEAARQFEKINSVKNAGRIAQCKALAEYTRSWLASTLADKAKMLDECRAFGTKALHEFQTARDELNYAKTCNLLLLCLFEHLYAAPTNKEKRIIAQEGMQLSNDALPVLSKLGDKSELLQAYSISSLQDWYIANISEQKEERETLTERSLNYSEKATALSKEVEDPYYVAMSRWAAAFCTLFFTEKIESAIEYAKEMLQQGIVVNDNYLKGVASYILAFTTDWTVPREENPDKRKERYEETIKYAQDAERYLALVAQNSIIGETYLFYGQSYSSLAHETPGASEKLALSKKAVEVGRKGLEYAVRSGSPDAIGSTLHVLSKALHFYASLEPSTDDKMKLLEEALGYREEYNNIVERAFPSMNWIIGVGRVYKAELEVELAKSKTDGNENKKLLQQAVADMDDGVLNCKKWIASRPTPSHTALVAEFEDSFGKILDEFYLLTEDEKILRKANVVYSDAANRFREVELISRVAESYWKIARNQDLLSEWPKASRNYDKACKEYEATAQRMPSFSNFFMDYALYMKAWSEIEKAKFAHNKGKYASAMTQYKKTANLLKQTKLWSYLSSNFMAWSHLEKSEWLSRNDKGLKSVEALNKAAELFSDAKNSLGIAANEVEDENEKYFVERLAEASDMRVEYCFGRVAIEEAKILDRQGEHVAGAEKYGSAAKIFQTIVDAGSEQNSRELQPTIYLCRAWQKMLLAEAKSSSGLYGEAAELFEKAKERSLDQSSSLLALAHSSFCKALEAGTKFEITRDVKILSAAKKHMEVAAGYYLKSGFQTAAEYANGTERLFDAYIFMETAEGEIDPEKKARYFMMAEKVLQFSVGSFIKAKHPEKIEQVKQILARVREEKELAGMLSDILHAPTIVSSTASFATLTPREEKAVGLESFERANIQATLVPQIQQVKTGEELTLEIHVVNVGKQAVLLGHINEVLPVGLELIAKPGYCHVEDSHVNLKGKRLDPLKTEEISLGFRSSDEGSFEVRPKIAYVDEAGRQLLCEPEPVTIEVSEVFPSRIATGHAELDKLLIGGIPETYSVILTSPFCDERDLLIKKFLKVGVEKGEIVFYFTVKQDEFIHLAQRNQSSVYLFTCNPHVDKEIKDSPNIFRLKGIERLTDISIALTKAFNELGEPQGIAKRACIEIVSDILLQHQAVQTRRWLAELITELKAKEFTTLAVMNPQMHPPQDVQAILGLFEGEITLEEKGPKKTLKIKRMYNQKYLDTELPITKEKLPK